MINEILMNIHSSEDIKNSFKSYENFLISLSNQFVYFLNNNIKINDVFIDNFKFYLNEYNLYINTNVLEFLNNLYQICKKYDYDDLLFIGEILNDNNYKTAYSVDNEIDELFFIKCSPACYDLVLRSKEICKFKYSNGKLLIDKVLENYIDSIKNQNENYRFYHKVIFNMLSNKCYTNSSKVDYILDKLHGLKVDLKKEEYNLDVRRLSNSIICLRDGINDKMSKILMDNYGIKNNYSSKIQNISSSYITGPIEDMRDRFVVTIDSKNRATKDDALSIYRDGTDYLLTLYIADVASFVPFNSLLFDHANQRGASLYIHNKKYSSISMFPSNIQEFFSLDSGHDKYVLAHEFRFNNNMELLDFNVKRAIINVSKNFSYDDFNKLSKFCPDDYSDMVRNFLDLSLGLIGNFKINIESKSMQVVSSFNLYLNSYMASYFHENKNPFIYLNTNMFPSCKVLDYELLPGYTSSYSNISTGNIINYNRPYGYVTKPIRNFSSFINQYFEIVNFVQNLECDKCYWNDILPSFLDKLNKRICLNNDYCDVISKCSNKRK